MNIDKELEISLENDEWISVSNLDEIKAQLRTAAKNTLIKDQRMNIRIAQRDLEGLKAKALEEGMPYQTLVASILHKYITGKLKEA